MRATRTHDLPTANRRYLLRYATLGRTRTFDDRETVLLVCTQFLRAAGQESVEILAYGFMPDGAHLMIESAAGARRFVVKARHYSASAYRARTGRRLWQPGDATHTLCDAETTRAAARLILDMPRNGSFAWDRLALVVA